MPPLDKRKGEIAALDFQYRVQQAFFALAGLRAAGDAKHRKQARKAIHEVVRGADLTVIGMKGEKVSDADLIDEVVVYRGPKPVGPGGLLPFVGDGLDRVTASGHFTEIEARSFGPDRMSWWRRVGRCSPALSAA
jgi:hypothetical protein